jgi:hypothetical protein
MKIITDKYGISKVHIGVWLPTDLHDKMIRLCEKRLFMYKGEILRKGIERVLADYEEHFTDNSDK